MTGRCPQIKGHYCSPLMPQRAGRQPRQRGQRAATGLREMFRLEPQPGQWAYCPGNERCRKRELRPVTVTARCRGRR
jgi:hypothetical protein